LRKDNVITGTEITRGKVKMQQFSWDDILVLRSKSTLQKSRHKDLQIKVFANLKSGVGKSSTSTQFALSSSAMGFKVLFIDLDPQAQGGLSLGFSNLDNEVPTCRNFMIKSKEEDYLSIKECIQPVTPMLDIVRSNYKLAQLDHKLQIMHSGPTKMRNILETVRDDYDIIVIDTNPSASITNIHAFVAADEILIVAETDFMSVAGLRQFTEVIEDFREDLHNDDFDPAIKVIANKFDVREAMAQASLGNLRTEYGELLAKVVIRKNVDLKEAQSRALPVWAYNKRSTASKDLWALTNELLTEE
jgi:chromosome partitioning protein